MISSQGRVATVKLVWPQWEKVAQLWLSWDMVEYGSGIAFSVGQAHVGGQGLNDPESFCV